MNNFFRLFTERYISGLLVIVLMFSFFSSHSQFSDFAPRPPMGWNSYDCFGFSVTEDEVKANADYMAEHLKEHGWEYVVVDFLWYGDGFTNANWQNQNPPIFIDEYGRMMPSAEMFPSSAGGMGFKPLADYVHSLGLKFGIHLMRGIPWNAVQDDTPVKGTDYTASQIFSNDGLCPWFSGMKTVDMSKPGAQEYYNSLVDLYASWGVDYLKIDDISRGTGNQFHPDEIEGYRKAIEQSGRPIVLSLSPGAASVQNAGFLKENSHLIRISNDIWDIWSQVRNQFTLCAQWQNHIGSGSWPDADMLPLGKISLRSEATYIHDIKPRYSRLTHDQQYTMMNLWSIFRSPLMFGGHLPENDDFTLKLITNPDIIRVNQYSENNRQISNSGNRIVWSAKDEEEEKWYVALFNVADSPQEVVMQLSALNSDYTKFIATELWTQESTGIISEKISATLKPHASVMYALVPAADVSTVTKKINSSPTFRLNPVPVEKSLYLTTELNSGALYTIRFFNTSGQLLFHDNIFLSSGKYTSDLSRIVPLLYSTREVVCVITDKLGKIVHTQKIVRK